MTGQSVNAADQPDLRHQGPVDDLNFARVVHLIRLLRAPTPGMMAWQLIVSC
jgi:hypothetical protein